MRPRQRDEHPRDNIGEQTGPTGELQLTLRFCTLLTTVTLTGSTSTRRLGDQFLRHPGCSRQSQGVSHICVDRVSSLLVSTKQYCELTSRFILQGGHGASVTGDNKRSVCQSAVTCSVNATIHVKSITFSDHHQQSVSQSAVE